MKKSNRIQISEQWVSFNETESHPLLTSSAAAAPINNEALQNLSLWITNISMRE